jgi:membrane protein
MDSKLRLNSTHPLKPSTDGLELAISESFLYITLSDNRYLNMNAPEKRSLYLRIRDFFTKEIWDIERENLTRFGKFIRGQLQIIFLVVRGFVKDKCINNASSLAFATLLTIIPLFAMMFPILKIFDAENKIRSIIADKFAAGNQEVAGKIFSLIESVNFKILGFAGIIFFIIVVVTIISKVEQTINDIWGIKKNRHILRKITDFFSILVIVPIFVFISTGITAYLKSQWYVQEIITLDYIDSLYNFLLSLSPYFSVWIAFTFFYLFIPNTKVKLKPAIIAGIVAGTLWQMAHAYINFGYIIRRYDLIYGSLAKLPIFMLWIFYSWVIVLFGAEISFAYQNLKTYRLEILNRDVSFAYKKQLALNIIISIADSFHYKKEPWDAKMLSEKYSSSLRLVNDILFMLTAEGFLVEVYSPKRAYVPAFEIDKMSIYDIVHKLEYKTEDDKKLLDKLLVNDKLKELAVNSEATLKDSLKDVTVKALIS